MRTLCALTGFLAIAGAGAVVLAPPAAATDGTTYYVDSTAGHDGDDGTTENTAWKTLEKVGSTDFTAGDRILLKAGSTWTGQLWPKGSGTAAQPITIAAYGSGPKPAIQGNGTVPDAVKLWNQQYWEIRDLDVSNEAPPTGTPGAKLGDFRGIRIGGDNGSQLRHFKLDALDVHDVTGEVNWIGGNSPDKPGIHYKTGWDRSKNTGGIVFEPSVTDQANPGSTATTLHDITLQNSTIKNTSFAGIVVKQYTGNADGAVETGWGTRTGVDDPNFAPHTDIRIRNNYITQTGTPYGANGMYLTGARDVVVENNVVDHVGTSGIESYYTDQVTIQRNEVFGTSVKAGGQDSNAIDTDFGTTRQTVQYNYVADNGEGFLIYQQQFGDSVFRYNIAVNSSRNPLHIDSSSTATGQVYNNVFYDTVGSAVYASTDDKYTLTNNIFYSTNGAATVRKGALTFDGNLYYGVTAPSADTHAIVGDPRFVTAAPGTDVTGTPRTTPDLSLGYRYALKPGSPALDTGAAITNNGGRDYRGNELYRQAPDIGALEQ
ncbi:right-handed parallel beta-helix repeat-containing protein [Streptomyces sp. NPDC005811]|uniref:right-handed parallel beta-helix repeat-containing protein n=1 Tax=Streptomyces sp. NPDC005811 TaxID=3154565 RepID=UPI0033EB39C8